MKSRPGLALVHRYLFYGWLFRDASVGTYLERAAALAHNREQSRWLPRYLVRWLVIMACALAAGRFCDVVLGNHGLAAVFYVLTTLTMGFTVVTAACWRLLRSAMH